MRDELLRLEEIEQAEEQYERNYGCAPFSLSTWNPSDYYRNTYLLNQTALPAQSEFINYIYSYELDARLLKECSRQLTGAEDAEVMITNSGTASIALVTSVLSALELHHILVISPTYFSVLYNSRQKGFTISELHALHRQGRYLLPKEDILRLLADIDALWITNPIYNTGVYMESEDKDFLLNHVLPDKYVVADECFCVSGRELMRELHGHPHFISIYDPMKQFLINGIKFSAVVFPSRLENMFNQWSDVVCGSLTTSTVQALRFFLSPAADRLFQVLRKADKEIQSQIKSVVSKYTDAELDDGVDGHMMMCYIPKLPTNHLRTMEDFYKFQVDTGVSVIPGTRFHFPEQDGFAFRINLARYDPVRFQRALMRALSYLTEA